MRRLVLAVTAALGTAGCSSPDDTPGDTHLVLVDAPASITPGATTPLTVLVRVMNGDNTAVAGVPVSWAVRSGGGRVVASADSSGLDGLAAAQWTPGLAAGVQEIGVSIYDDPALIISVQSEAFHADRMDAGYGGVCGLQGTSTWCWVLGRNNNQTYRVLSQVQAKTLALSDSYACVVDVAGATYCYRYDQYSPSSDPDAYETVTGLPAISAISAGDNYFCGIDASDLTPWCWTGAPFFAAAHVSTTLRLTSISAGNYHGCGLAEDGTAWCWDSFDAPSAVPGGHTFRQVGVGITTACAIESPARLYCWDRGQSSVLMPGASPGAIAMGYDLNLMNVQSGTSVFRADPAQAQLTFIEQAAFPSPALQMSGDDNLCLIALDATVYCLGMGSGYDVTPTNWVAIPAPVEPANAR